MKLKSTFCGHTEELLCINNLSASVFASGSEDRSARIWDTKSKYAIRANTGFNDSVCEIEVSWIHIDN
jgi:WD40 repeat protein